jgi:chromosome segregation ATPase
MAATAKKPAAKESASFQEVAANRMRDRIEQYRQAVTAAAGGKVMSADDVDAVLALLDAMGLPDFAWQRDVDAYRELQRVEADVARLEAERPERAERIKSLEAQIKASQQQIADAQAEIHTLANLAETQFVNKLRRQTELVNFHPHVFAAIDEAVQLRLDAKNKSRAVPPASVPATVPATASLPGTGWSN